MSAAVQATALACAQLQQQQQDSACPAVFCSAVPAAAEQHDTCAVKLLNQSQPFVRCDLHRQRGCKNQLQDLLLAPSKLLHTQQHMLAGCGMLLTASVHNRQLVHLHAGQNDADFSTTSVESMTADRRAA
jgi:hypothetical protein